MSGEKGDTPGDLPGVGQEALPARDGRIDSETLFGDAELVLIEHNGETYILRKTRQGKLILTK